MADPALLIGHCAAALQEQRRRPDFEPTDAFRLLHGRGGLAAGLHDLSVDWYGGHVLMVWYPGQQPWSGQQAQCLAEPLFDALAPGSLTLQIRGRPGAPARYTLGAVPEAHRVTEAGLTFWVRLGGNQNVGLFLDMAPLRRWLREQAAGARVLNLFAYTGSLSVAAAAGGALEVVNLDMSRSALAWAQKNHALNQESPTRVRMLPHNLFRSWGALRRLGPFDGVIIDPPTRQRGSFHAERQYPVLLRRLPELLAPGAWIRACLNSPHLGRDFLPEVMRQACPAARYLGQMPAAAAFVDREPDRALKISEFVYQP